MRRRLTLFLGLTIIFAMCLVPPFKVGPGEAGANGKGGESPTRIEYRPVWVRSDAPDGAALTALGKRDVAGTRLLVQIVVVALVTGGVAYGGTS